MSGKSNRFHAIAAGLPAKAGVLLDAYQGFGLDLAVQLAPYEDGDLKGSGTMAPGDTQYQRQVQFTAEHAPHQEFGTIHMQPQPFLRPAFDEIGATFGADAKVLLEP